MSNYFADVWDKLSKETDNFNDDEGTVSVQEDPGTTEQVLKRFYDKVYINNIDKTNVEFTYKGSKKKKTNDKW